MERNYAEELVRTARLAGFSPEQIISYLQDKYNDAMKVIGNLLEKDVKVLALEEEFIDKLQKLKENAKA